MCRVIHLWDDTSLWRWAVQSQAFSCDGDTDRRQSHGFTESRWQYLGVTRGLSVTRQHCVLCAYFPWTIELPKDSKTGDEERWDIYLWKGPAVEKVWDKRWTGDCLNNKTTTITLLSFFICFYLNSQPHFLTLPYSGSCCLFIQLWSFWQSALSHCLFLALSLSRDQGPTKTRTGRNKLRENRETERVIPGCRQPFALEWSVD